jgi:hypothetical protein
MARGFNVNGPGVPRAIFSYLHAACHCLWYGERFQARDRQKNGRIFPFLPTDEKVLVFRAEMAETVSTEDDDVASRMIRHLTSIHETPYRKYLFKK